MLSVIHQGHPGSPGRRGMMGFSGPPGFLGRPGVKGERLLSILCSHKTKIILTSVLYVADTVLQGRKVMRVTKEKKDLLVLLDPKGIEALKVGEMVQVPENVVSARVKSVTSADLFFVVLKGIKESKAWRVVQVIRVQKVVMESVQIPVSLAMVLQVKLVCLVLQDHEVCLVSWDPKVQ